ncbi:response regulator [Flavobacterium sp. Sd200]|nr:response regulator [Flavobacterium sp. Sd200]
MSTKILIVEDQFVEANHLRLMLTKAGYAVCGVARTVSEAKEAIKKNRPGLVLLDIFLIGRETGIDLAKYLNEENIGFIYLSANSNEEVLNAAKATRPYGFIVKPFRERDLLVTLQIAGYHQQYGIESSIRKEQLFQKQISRLMDDSGTWDERLFKIGKAVQPLVPFDLMVAIYRTANESEDIVLGFLRVGFSEYQKITVEDLQNLSNLKISEIKKLQVNTVVDARVSLYAGADFQKVTQAPTMKKLIADYLGMRANLTLPIPLSINKNDRYFFSFFSRKAQGFNEAHFEVCKRLQQPLIYMVENILMKDKNYVQKIIPKPTLKTTSMPGFEGIIGKSPLLVEIFDHIAQVAPGDTTVLVTGESGTGKERIASSIHNLSGKKGPLIKVNCASLPSNLIETELFGHEKGAFTGATDRRVGRFELADKGTLFLDEIGEMPLDMQVKLLRVLQEKEIERIGGSKPIKVDVRIVAATNRNLEKEVAEGRFRLDLYYRLNVFPIHLPALRDRKEDITLLAKHFIDACNARTGKSVTGLSTEARNSLLAYNWPGNIRELENFIERGVLLAKGPVIETIALPQHHEPLAGGESQKLKTIEENERTHIVAVLKQCGGRIRGANGAAVILGVPPTTLASKMQKLGIKRRHI